MSPLIGWGLAAAAVVVGFMSYGWPGLLLALSVVVFWLLLQFSRAVRVMRNAAERPLGHIASAVMLQSKLQPGMRLLQIVALTRSLGEKLADEPETFVWRDAGGDAVRVELRDGRVSAFRLDRAAAAAGEEAHGTQAGEH